MKEATTGVIDCMFSSERRSLQIAQWWQTEKKAHRITVVQWRDQTTTTVRQYLRDANDPEAAIAAAYVKKMFGSRNKFKKRIEETHLKAEKWTKDTANG